MIGRFLLDKVVECFFICSSFEHLLSYIKELLILHHSIQIITNDTLYSDRELLLLILQQNEDAFTTFYYRYYDLLCRKAYRRIPEEAIVEEIVQDVFVTFWNKADTLDANGNIAAWLYATLRNKVLHHARTEQTRLAYIKKLEQLQGDMAADAQEKLDLKQTEAEIHTIIQSLPAQCKEAFVLSRYENLSYREIAERMGISVNTVEKHIGKALQILRKGLEDYPVSIWLLFLTGIELAEKFIK